MEGYSKDLGREATTRPAKRPHEEEEEEEATTKKQKVQEPRSLQRKDKIPRPQDLIRDTELRKVKIAPEKGRKEPPGEVKVEPEVKSEAQETKGSKEERILALSTKVRALIEDRKYKDLRATLAEMQTLAVTLEAELELGNEEQDRMDDNKKDRGIDFATSGVAAAEIPPEVTGAKLAEDKIVAYLVKSWDPLAKRLHLSVPDSYYEKEDSLAKVVLNRYVGVTHLEINIIFFKENRIDSLSHLFPDLETLWIRGIMGKPDIFLEACLSACPKLQSLSLPAMPEEEIPDVIQVLRKKIPVENSNLKTIDFDYVRPFHSGSLPEAFVHFIRDCVAHGVKILNPPTNWHLTNCDRATKQLLGTCVTSLRMDGNSYDSYLWDVPWETLESLSVTRLGNWVFDLHGRKMAGKMPPGKWTRLSKLNLLLIEYFNRNFSLEHISCLCKFLVERSPNVKELLVIGKERWAALLLQPALLRRWNLRKLTLCDIYNRCKFLEKAWPELSSLEELYIDDCAISKEKWFTSRNSTLLQLTNLRVLRLENIEGILDENDQFLRNVLSQMQLTHLHIISSTPIADVNLVPRAAIESLMKGRCGQSLKELTVDGWPLKDLLPGNDENTA